MAAPLLAIPLAKAALSGLAAGAAPLVGEAGKAIASVVDPAARAYREQMQKDITALREGKLGLSEAEKRTMLAGTQRALQAQTAGTEAMLRRSAAAQGGFGRSGAQQQALGTIGAQQREKLAEAAGGVDALSQEVAQRRFADVMQRIYEQRKEARDTGERVAGGVAAGVMGGAAAYPELYKKFMEEQAQQTAERARMEALKTERGQQLPPGTLVRK